MGRSNPLLARYFLGSNHGPTKRFLYIQTPARQTIARYHVQETGKSKMKSVEDAPRVIKCKVWMPHFKTSSHQFSREFDFLMWCSPERLYNASTMEFAGKYMSMGTENPGRKKRRGRPPTSQGRARSRRVVAFVTEAEYLRLEEIAIREDRSLASVLYRIVSKHLGINQ